MDGVIGKVVMRHEIVVLEQLHTHHQNAAFIIYQLPNNNKNKYYYSSLHLLRIILLWYIEVKY